MSFQMSPELIAVLKNFSAINPNIVFADSGTIKTMSEAKNILATAEIDHPFPQGVGVYDLNEFLSCVSMFNQPSIEFFEDNKFLKIKEGKRSIKYFFSSPEIMEKASNAYRPFSFPGETITFSLDTDEIKDLKKAASTLGLSELVVSYDGSGEVSAIVTDTKNPTANSFSYELRDVELKEEIEEFTFIFDIGNIKVMAGEYEVAIHSKLISKFTNTSVPINYIVGLEKTSRIINK